MTSSTISLDIMDTYRRNASSKYATFDLHPRKGAGSETPTEPYHSKQSLPFSSGVVARASSLASDGLFNPEVSVKTDPSRAWDSNIAVLVSTKNWLKMYGLKKNRLDLESLIKQIAFRHSDDFDHTLKMPVCSRYGTNLFQKYFRPDGQSFNIIVTPQALKQLEMRLIQAISLFKRRLNWLTSESRRIFGVIEERVICIVLDFKELTDQQLHLYLSAIERTLLEQVSQLNRFNLIQAADDPVLFSGDLVSVSPDSISRAVEWLWKLDNKKPVPKSAAVEALVKALAMPYVDSVFLFTEGSSTDGCREMIRERMVDSRVPLHFVSYNCTDPDTVEFLKNLAVATNCRFHAYAVVMEMDTFERVDNNEAVSQSSLVLKKKAYGGVPKGAGMREDVILLFEELEEAKNNLAQIQAVMKDQPPSGKADEVPKTKDKSEDQNNETYMSSAQWLAHHGLQAKRLCFYEALSSVAFKHQDGVIDLKVPPVSKCYISDANTVKKLINAKYCDRFAHVVWKDGQLMHVQVTPEFLRLYKDRLGITLEAMQRRVDWLHRGSREIFGTVIENRIYLLIDTSLSMQAHLQFVKEKLFLLMQEQLRHKQMINIIAFNSRVYLWQKSLVEVSEKTFQHAWNWIKALTCNGSTNTMAALQHALADRETEAIYLLTDGRPDQPPKSIIKQSKMPRAIPIHTISFNCNDREANEFLYELAKESAGRFHYYSQDGCEIDLDGPEPWQSEDIALLRKEIELGWSTMEKIEKLKDECELLSKSKNNSTTNTTTETKKPALPKHVHSDTSPLPLRVSKDFRPASSNVRDRTSSARLSSVSQRPKSASAKASRISCDSPPIAAHTKTSLLRTLSSNGHFGSAEWLLPETKELLEQQERRKKSILEAEEKKLKLCEKKTKKLTNSQLISSKKWLAKHGLSAKKLTIIDALSPTFIPHDPKYVPILDKQVLSKVFDDVLPIAYLSKAKKRLHLVNPLAVDLDLYVSKVKDAIDLYKKRLNRIVWNALSKEQKEELGSDIPVSFIDNEVALMQAMAKNGWQVREKDIQLLVREIQNGESYISQARDLKEAARKYGDGLPEYKENNSRNMENKTEREGGNESLNSALKKNNTVPPRSGKLELKVSWKPVAGKNLKVVARDAEDGFFYPAIIKENVDVRRAEVQYSETNSTEVVPTRFIIPLVGALSRPPLTVGDFVLCRVINEENGRECYVPGRITAKPIEAEDHGKFYAVSLYTGQQEQFLRINLIKISRSRYQFTARYVKEVAAEKKSQMDRSSDEESEEKESSMSDDGDDSDDDDGADSCEERELKNKKVKGRKIEEEEEEKEKEDVEEAEEEEDDEKSGRTNGAHKMKSLQKLLRQYIKHQSKQKKELKVKIKKYLQSKRKGQRKERLEKQLVEIDRMQDELSGNLLLSDRNKVVPKKPRHHKFALADFSPVLEMRRRLGNIGLGEEVLARWSDDGWYYTGTVKDRCGEDCYFIQDSLGDVEKIWREDIIANDDSCKETIHKGDSVVAIHPDFTFSYCPSKVKSLSKDTVTVVFYDKQEDTVSRDEVYLIPEEKYDYDVKNIIACEERWVGHIVVARNNDTGLFYLGKVKERIGDGRQYKIEWTDGTSGIQKANYIFGPFSKLQDLGNGDFVLAMMDDAGRIVYKPGIIRKGSVEFYDLSRVAPFDADSSFGLTEDFYDHLVNFLKEKDVSTDSESEESSKEVSRED